MVRGLYSSDRLLVPSMGFGVGAVSWYYNYAGSANPLTHLNANGSWRSVRGAFDEFSASPMTTGINLAWLEGAYDHDFGLNPLHPAWGVAYTHEASSSVIDDLVDVGISMLRVWLFEGCARESQCPALASNT